MQSLWVPHLDATKRILRYVKSTIEFGMLYKMGEKFFLGGFTDVNWEGDINDRRSTSLYCFTIGSTAVSWHRKQSSVALSSTERQNIWLQLRLHKNAFG